MTTKKKTDEPKTAQPISMADVALEFVRRMCVASTQLQVAERIGLTPSTINMVLLKRGRYVRLDHLDAEAGCRQIPASAMFRLLGKLAYEMELAADMPAPEAVPVAGLEDSYVREDVADRDVDEEVTAKQKARK